MTAPDPSPVTPAAGLLEHPRADVAAHMLVVFGSLMASIGTRMMRARNEYLADQAATSYQLGRAHERDGVPDPGADVDEHQGHADVDEPDELHQPAAAE